MHLHFPVNTYWSKVAPNSEEIWARGATLSVTGMMAEIMESDENFE